MKLEENLSSLQWEKVQELGKYIPTFKRMSLSRKRALGEIHEPIEKYRDSFRLLIHGDGEITDRMNTLLTDERYSLYGFGESAIGDLIGHLFPDQYCLYNQRDKVAVENVLQLQPKYARGDSYVDKFIKFQQCLKENDVINRYISIVDRQTELPMFLELDRFFDFVSRHDGKSEAVSEQTSKELGLEELAPQEVPITPVEEILSSLRRG